MKHLPLDQNMRRAFTKIKPIFVFTLLITMAVFCLAPQAQAGPPAIQTFFVPLTELQVQTSLMSVNTGGTTGNVMSTIISIAATGDNTILYYDHWEDGYEADMANPVQASTAIWGDNDPANGIPPGFATDLINAGDIITLDNTVSLPRNPALLLYDGRDKFGGTRAVAVTRTSWALSPGVVLAGAVEVYPLRDYGLQFEVPVGEDLSSDQMFEYVSLIVLASADGTSVQIDTDGDGFTDITQTLNQGESYQVDGGIQTGASVIASQPVQAHTITGDIGARYESRFYTLYPVGTWSDSYFNPVGTAADGDQTYIFVYNPNGSPITVNYETRNGTGSFAVAAGSAYRYLMPSQSGAHFFTDDGSTFFAIATVGADPGANNVHDWGFSLLPESYLTSVAVVGWGPGSDGLSGNGSPVWVTTVESTTVYVDYDGDPTTGPLIDANGDRYDVALNPAILESVKVYDNNDNDQTGMRLYTLDSTFIAAAWGQDPATSQAGAPFLDLGTTVLPFPFVSVEKTSALVVDQDSNGLINWGDTVEYTITINNDGVVVLGGVVAFDPLPAGVTYVPDSTTLNGAPVTDEIAPATPYPMDEGGLSMPVIPPTEFTTIIFRVVVDNGTTSILNTVTVNTDHSVLTTDDTIDVNTPDVTACSLEFTNGSGASRATYLENSDIYVTVDDNDQNTDAGTLQSFTVVVINPDSGDAETITLVETGNDTGVFRNTAALVSSNTGGLLSEDGTLYAWAGNTLQVAFTDPVYGDACSDTAGIVQPTDTKPLYLSEPGQSMDRVDPVATGDSTTATSAELTAGTTETVREEFNPPYPGTYDANDGSVNWKTAWSELSDDGLPGSGDVVVTGDRLRIQSAGNGGSRTVDLSSATTATLSFHISAFDNGDDYWLVEANDGSGWTTIQAFDPVGSSGNVTERNQTVSYTLEDYVSLTNNVEIRFRVTQGFGQIGIQYVSVDDVQIAYLIPGSSTTSFSQVPSMCHDFFMPAGGPITVTTYIAANSGASGSDYVLDAFNPPYPGTYDANDGSVNWKTAWSELSDDGLPGSGDVVVTGDRLRIQSAGNGGSRTVDLSSATTATLSFHISAFDNGDDYWLVEANDGSGWTTIQAFDPVGSSGNVTERNQTVSYTLEDYVSLTNNVEIRFRVTQGFGQIGIQYVSVDDVRVEYSTSGGGSVPADPDITVSLKRSGTIFATLTNPTVTDLGSGNYRLDFTGALSGDTTVFAGEQVQLDISTAESGLSFAILYDSSTYPSRVDLPTTTVILIQVNTLAAYDAPYPGGSAVTNAENGDTLYIRATVSDPFGTSDITDVNLVINDPCGGAPLNATLDDGDVVATGTCSKTYEYAWATTSCQGSYDITVTANEGTEGISDTAAIRVSLSHTDTGTPGSTAFTDATGTPVVGYNPNDSICIQVTDMDQNTNPAVAETVTATITSPQGDSETMTLTETGVDSGVFRACIASSNTVPGAPDDSSLYTVAGDLIDAAYTDPTDAADTSGDTATISSAVPAMSINKSLGDPADGSSALNDPVRFDIVVANPGTTTLTTYTVTDTFPTACLTYDAASTAPATTAPPGTLTWTQAELGTIAAGDSVSLSVWFTAAAACAPAVNSASASGQDQGGTPVSAGPAAAEVTITEPALSVSKTLISPNPGPAYIGDPVTFRITLQNTGGTEITTLPLTDSFSAACYTYQSATPVPDGVGADSLMWNDLGPLAVGASTSVDVVLTAAGECNPAQNTADVSFAVDENGDDVPAASDSAGLQTIGAHIGDIVWNDRNGDGVQDPGEGGIAGVIVFVDTNGDGVRDPGEPYDTTNISGGYDISGLAAGTFTVSLDAASVPAGAVLTTGNDPVSVSVTAGEDFNGADFGFQGNAFIGDFIWDDLNGDGNQDGGEPGLDAVTVFLDLNGNGVPDFGEPSALTDAGGNYDFNGLTPGDYTVDVDDATLPPNYALTTGNDPLALTLSDGQDFNTADFGYRLQEGVTGHLFNDVNGNGVQDPGEPDLAGVDVVITDSGSAQQTVTTDTDGNYQAVVPPGSTTLDVDDTSLPPGAALTTANDPQSVTVNPGVFSAGTDVGYQFAVVSITKTSDAAGPVSPGQTLTYTMTVSNNTGSTHTGITVSDNAPAGTTYVSQSTSATIPPLNKQVLDNFSTASYDNNDGPDNWEADWVEVDGGGATGGNVLITGGELTLDDNPNTGGYPSAAREVDLSGGYTSANFSFDFRTSNNLEDTDRVVVEISSNGGGTYFPLDTFTNDVSGSRNHDISGYISADTRIRFRVDLYYGGPGEMFYVDNVQITATRASITMDNNPASGNPQLADGTPPNLVVAGDSVNLATGETMTVTFQVTVDDPPPLGLTEIINTAEVTSDQQASPETATVIDPLIVPGSIGNFVWLDSDGDGNQDVGEAGLGNVMVSLYADDDGTPGPSPGDTLAGTTTTDVNGNYLFSNLAPGDYYVDVNDGSIPAGLTPSAGTTDPGAVFTLTAGGRYLDADFGYTNAVSTTAIVGDLVFSDADGDGLQDPGEPGMGGVTLDLMEIGPDGVRNTADDVLMDTATTAADGSYLFSGINPGEYTVVVTDTGAVLTGYSLTTFTEPTPVNVAAGDVMLNVDFGYQNAGGTYLISDGIWYDADADGTRGAGESGISSVSINLLDNGGSIIATTTTDANGDFSFAGISNGDYTISISDNGGLLTGLAGTTAAAAAGSLAVTVSGADVSGTNFGYNLAGTIGDTVFSDANSNGTQDAGESGLANITVQLWLDDGDGTFDDTVDTLVGTTTSATGGSYQFFGRGTGTYFASVDDSQAILTGYIPTTNDDQSGANATGTQINVVLPTAAAGSLDADFGYRDSSLALISGSIWEDYDADAVVDAGEPALAGVTLVLLDSNANVLAMTTTNAGGAYTFSGVANGIYTVEVTDTAGVLVGYVATTAGGDQQPVTVTGGNDETGLYFGYYRPTPTAVDLIAFTATGQAGAVRVAWQTAHEINHMGFYLYRSDSPAGPFIKLTERLIPGALFSSMGRQYEYVDTDVIQGQLYYYRLEDVDTYGARTYHGPICVDWDADGLPDDWEIAHGLDPTVNDADLDADNDGLTNLEEYERGSDPNNPDSNGDGILDGDEHFQYGPTDPGGSLSLSRGVHILASDETGTTLELRTEAFETATVEVGAGQFEKLSIKEYVHGYSAEVGKPQLPLKGILLDIPEGQSAQLTVLDSASTIGYGYQVYPVPQNYTDELSYDLQVAELFTMDADAYGQDAFYPASVAGLGEVYNFRDQLKQRLIFYPLSFNPVSGQIRHYNRIRVRVDYEDADLARTPNTGPQPWLPPSGDKILNHPIPMGPTAMAFIGPAFLNSPIISAIASLGNLAQAAWMPPGFDWTTQGPAYKIQVAQAGLYRLTGSYLEASGVNLTGVNIGQVRLYNLGTEIALTVYDENGDNGFDGNDYIEFYATAVASEYAKYTNNNVYWLTLAGGSGAPLRMGVINGAPAAGQDTAVTHDFTVHYEPDDGYWQEAPGADSLDRWFIGAIALGDEIDSPSAGQPVTFDLPLVDVDDTETGTLKISLYGGYDTDHEVRVSYEGEDLGTFAWSGYTSYEVVIEDVNFTEKIEDGNYRVSVTCLSGFDRIAFDWIEATYPREFMANDDRLKFTHDSGYLFAIDDFSTDELMVLDITDTDDPMRVDGFDIYEPEASSFSLEFETAGDGQTHAYLVIAEAQVQTTAAAVVEDSGSDLGDSANGADYILITHQDIGWDGSGQTQPWVDDLVTQREAQGLRVKVVNVQDIYDEFSYGLVTPQAIKDFLTYAYENWSPPAPQYVVFVGDSSYDYKDNWGLGTINYVPAYLIYTEFMGETVTDEWFVTVTGDDAAADMYIGRLPATSATEAQVMVDKVIAYETGPNTKTWEKNTLLVADDQEEAFESVFKTMNEDAAALLPTGMEAPYKGYLQDYLDAGFSPVDLNSDILDQINAGALIANFSGHGHLQGWASESIFDAGDIDALTNAGKYPFIVSMNCLTGYFAYPDPSPLAVSFAELLLRAVEKGTAAALMPTGMTTTEGQHVMNTALFETIFVEDIRKLGPAIARSKRELLANGDAYFEQVSQTFLLFGDPAMQLRVPLPRRPAGLVPAFWTKIGVALSWGETTDCNNDPVAGYNVYRSTSPTGSFTKINTAAITEEEYTDNTASAAAAAASAIYYYTVTAVDTDGDESIASAMVASPNLAAGTAIVSGGSGGGGGGCFVSAAANSFKLADIQTAAIYWVLMVCGVLALLIRLRRTRV